MARVLERGVGPANPPRHPLLDNLQLIHSIVSLIEKPGVPAFESALIATLNQLVPNKSVRLWQIRENPEPPHEKVAVLTAPPQDKPGGPRPHDVFALEDDPVLAECFRTGVKVSVGMPAGGGVRIVHPLKTAEGVIGLLALECAADDLVDQGVVSALLGFYTNYIFLLRDSEHDTLTGLLNRKTFDEKLLRIIGERRAVNVQADGSRKDHCLALLDIDHFKRVNDNFGHLHGDEVLLRFARAMVQTFRGSDLLFRLGGEEFVVILGEIDLDRASSVFKRFLQTVETTHFPQVGKVTASVGLTVITGSDMPSAIVGRADKALYYGKNNGRNQVCVYESLVAEGKVEPIKDEGGRKDVELF